MRMRLDRMHLWSYGLEFPMPEMGGKPVDLSVAPDGRARLAGGDELIDVAPTK